ncbi:MAG: hypothetical protein ACJA2D_002381, partial [Pseudohongiellaceae bacterium]
MASNLNIGIKFATSTAILSLAIFALTNATAQEIDYPDSFNEPMALFPEAMGDFHFPISSDV